MNRRGSVTLFIILGILILVGIALLVIPMFTEKEEKIGIEVEEKMATPEIRKPVEEFIKQCIDETTKQAFARIAKNGGKLFQSEGGPDPDALQDEQYKDVLYVNYGDDKVFYAITPESMPVDDERCFLAHKELKKGEEIVDDRDCRYEDPNAPTKVVKWCDPYEKGLVAGYDLPLSAIQPTQMNEYPWRCFPYTNDDMIASTHFGEIFGKNTLPKLNKEDSPTSFESKLEVFIANNIETCVHNFSAFSTYEVIDTEKPVVDVAIAKKNIHVKIDYNVVLEYRGASIKFEHYEKDYPMQLRELYLTAFEIIKRDIVDADFDPGMIEGLAIGDIEIKHIEGGKSSDLDSDYDDVFILTDKSSRIGTQFLEFRFARKNRAPAMEYFPIVRREEIVLRDGDKIFFEKENNELVLQTWSREKKVMGATVAYDTITPPELIKEVRKKITFVDPDEDDVEVVFTGYEGMDTEEGYEISVPNCCEPRRFIEIPFKITDGEYTDSQYIRIPVTGRKVIEETDAGTQYANTDYCDVSEFTYEYACPGKFNDQKVTPIAVPEDHDSTPSFENLIDHTRSDVLYFDRIGQGGKTIYAFNSERTEEENIFYFTQGTTVELESGPKYSKVIVSNEKYTKTIFFNKQDIDGKDVDYILEHGSCTDRNWIKVTAKKDSASEQPKRTALLIEPNFECQHS